MARALRPPPPHERGAVLRGDAALLLDGLLTRVARQHGALDVAIGEVLHALAQGDRLLRLGFSGLGDYARERLGIAPSTARALARLAEGLAVRPLLGEAVRKGDLSARKAQVVLPVAIGEGEAPWIARARRMTVRELDAAVRAARRGNGEPEPDEASWSHVAASLSVAQRETVDRALELARKLVGHAAPRWELLQALCEEYLAEHPLEPGEADEPALLRSDVNDWLRAAKEGLEHETARWSALEDVHAVEAPCPEAALNPFALDEQLRELADMRDHWDELVGHLAMLLRMLGLWRDLGFATFGHYCTERLQMAVRTVEQRAALERRLHALPGLRRALEERRISYEKARIVARHATERSLREWLECAEQMTCVALSRKGAAETEAQMCSSGVLRVTVPASTAALLDAACRSVRRAEGRWLAPGECLERVARHFVATWEPVLQGRRTPQSRVLERDGGWCQVPGCSHAAVHVHHITYRSHQGSDAPENLIALCAAHHLHGIHRGYIRVEGRAPDGLTWELGLRPGFTPLLTMGVSRAA